MQTVVWPWKLGQGHQNLMSLKMVLRKHLWKSELIWSNGSWDIVQTIVWPWKWGQGHQNLITSKDPSKEASVKIWTDSVKRFLRYRANKDLKAYAGRDLENEVKVTKT